MPWRLRLRVPRADVALANAPVEAEHETGDGLKLVTFAESKPLPSCLVAFVVGPFDVVDAGTAGRYGTPLRFVLPPGRREELRYARGVTPRVVELKARRGRGAALLGNHGAPRAPGHGTTADAHQASGGDRGAPPGVREHPDPRAGPLLVR